METGGLIHAVNRMLISAVPATSNVPDAVAEIDRFRARTVPSPWKLDRAQVAKRMWTLVHAPTRVNQGALGTCGAAVFLRCWIEEDPLGFVKVAGSLFDTGRARLGTLDLEPSTDLMGQTWTEKRMLSPAADWMMLCSLLERANLLWDYDGTPEDRLGAGMWGLHMHKWFEATNHALEVSDFLIDPELIRRLIPTPTRHVIVAVHTYLLEKRTRDARGKLQLALGLANHYIVLEAPVYRTLSGQTKLVAWTWGRTTTFDVSEEDLDRCVDSILVARH